MASVRRAGQNANRALEAVPVHGRLRHAGRTRRRDDDVVGHMYSGPQQPSFDDGAVEHGLLRLVILLTLDMRDERVRRVLTDDLIPSLELNNVAVVEWISTENRPGKGARDIAPSDACQRWKGGYPLREGDFDIGRPAVGLRLRAGHTCDARWRSWRKGLAAARRGEDAEADKRVSHGATPFNRNLNLPCKI